MHLFTDRVSVFHPIEHFIIQFVFGLNSQIVRMAPVVECLDFVKTRVVDAPGQYEMTNKVRLAGHAAGEAYPGLKNNARFLRDHVNGAACRDKPGKLSKNAPDMRVAPRKEISKGELPA